ncbi:MAG: hypothetical protein HN348_20785, partial [Proteobacteria bacterium]|nr:hypothetical protein [Pseudomonadota bacterium]
DDETGEVQVKIKPEGPTHLPLDMRSVALFASAGKLGEPEPAGNGWIATWTPPKKHTAPTAVLFTATDRTAPEDIHGWSILPMSLTTTYEAGAAGSVLHIGERTFERSAEGEFIVPLLPADRVGELHTPKGDEVETKELNLENPATPQLAFAPWPDRRTPVGHPARLLLAITDAAGVPMDDITNLKLTGPGGLEAELLQDGWHEIYVETNEAEWTVDAQMGFHTARARGALIEGLPKLAMTMDPAELDEETKELTLTVRAKDPKGGALLDRHLDFWALGAKAKGSTKDHEDGSYTQLFSIDKEAQQVNLTVDTTHESSGLPPVRLRIQPVLPGLMAGTTTQVPVKVLAEDFLGLPVPNLDLTLSVPVGDGTLTPEVNTGENGIGWAKYAVGAKVGPSSLVVRTGNLVASCTFWQQEPNTTISLPPLGNRFDAAVLEAWQNVAPAAAVGRGQEPLTTVELADVEDVEDLVAEKPGREKSGRSGNNRGSSGKKKNHGQIRLGLVDSGYKYSQEAPGAEDVVPAETSFSQPAPFGAMGFSASADYWLFNRVGFDLRARWVRYRIDNGDDDSLGDSLGSLMANLRVRQAIVGPLYVQGGAGFHRTDVLAIKYADNRTRAATENVPINGLRLVAGLALEIGPIGFAIEGAETFAAAPKSSSVLANLDVAIPFAKPLLIHASYGLDWRHLKTDVKGAEAKIRDRQNTFIIGAGISL